MSEILSIKNARNQKSTFDLRWAIINLLLIVTSIIYGPIRAEVGISDVGFYVTTTVSNWCRNFRDRIRVPTADDQPFDDPPDVILPKKIFKMPNVAAELIRCGILCVIHVWYLQNCMLRRQV